MKGLFLVIFNSAVHFVIAPCYCWDCRGLNVVFAGHERRTSELLLVDNAFTFCS